MILNLPTFCQLWSLTLEKVMGIQHSVRWKIVYPHSISTPPSLNTSAKFKFRLFMLESNNTKFAHFLSTLVSHTWKSYGYPAFGKVKDCFIPIPFQPHLHWTRQPSLNSDCSCWMESNDTKFAHFLSTLVSHAWKSCGYPAFGKVKDCLIPIPFQPHLHWTRQPSLNSDCSCWMESNDTKFAHFLSTLVSHAWKSCGYPAFGMVKDCLSPFHFNPTFTEHVSQV